MINNEDENKVFNEKLFDLIRVVLKKRPKSTINMICNIISMSAEGKFYEKKEIAECLKMAIDNGLIISDENGNIAVKSKEENNNEKAIKFRNSLKCTQEELAENLKKQKEEKEKESKISGYHVRRSNDGKSRFS
ncbi:MAG: hypothetical protein J6M60_01475 [Clostridia bacterium]|nr:hypothetical protein [Clostridia bacterium]